MYSFFLYHSLGYPMLMPTTTHRCAHWSFKDVNMRVGLEIEELGDFSGV